MKPDYDLIYVYLGGSPARNSSVQKKVIDQIEGLNRAGIRCIGWFFTRDVHDDTPEGSYVLWKPLAVSGRKSKGRSKQREKQLQIDAIHQALIREDEKVFFFIRHMSSGSAYFKMIKDLGSRIVLYIPSNTLKENYQEFISGWNGSVLIRLIKFMFYLVRILLPDWRFYTFYTSKVKACVAFTPEFCNIIRRRSLAPVKTIYNRDGANGLLVPVRKPIQSTDSIVRLLFMKGSQSVQRWSGLDRLIKSIQASGKGRFELYITGKVYENKDYNGSFIKLTGRLSDEELSELICKVDLGVSNLANYLIGFSETTNLKSREYFMRGLPFIQANTMPDIEGTALSNYYLNLPNNNTLINMDEVYHFAMKMRLDQDHPEVMRKHALERLDWKITTKELAGQLLSCLDSGTKENVED